MTGKLRQQKWKVSSHVKTNKNSTQTKQQQEKNPVRSREGQMLAFHLLSLFYTIQDPSPGHDATHS